MAQRPHCLSQQHLTSSSSTCLLLYFPSPVGLVAPHPSPHSALALRDFCPGHPLKLRHHILEWQAWSGKRELQKRIFLILMFSMPEAYAKKIYYLILRFKCLFAKSGKNYWLSSHNHNYLRNTTYSCQYPSAFSSSLPLPPTKTHDDVF